LHSHAEYSNQELARVDLQQRMRRATADFELVPHTESQITSAGTKITTKSLKVRSDYAVRQEVFRSLLECMKLGREDPNLTEMSNTADWKLVSFAQNTLLRDQLTELIKKKHRYLHNVRAISFINLGSLEGSFHQELVREGVNGKRKGTSTTEEAPAPIENEKSTGEEINTHSRSNKKRDVNNIEEDKDMDDASDANDKGAKIADREDDTINMEEDRPHTNTHEETPDTQDFNGEGVDEITEIEDTMEDRNEATNNMTTYTLFQMLAISAGDGTSLFNSWESGRMDQFYFRTTTHLEDRANE